MTCIMYCSRNYVFLSNQLIFHSTPGETSWTEVCFRVSARRTGMSGQHDRGKFQTQGKNCDNVDVSVP